MIRTSLLALLVLSATAYADSPNHVSLTGWEAARLTIGLKLAGVAPHTYQNNVVYFALDVSCTETDGNVTDDGLMTTSCQPGGPTTIEGAEAIVLERAMYDELATHDMPVETHTSKTTRSVASISCVIAADAKGMRNLDRFSCEVGLRKPLDMTITPKKVPIKDIVQPVKIEKQK